MDRPERRRGLAWRLASPLVALALVLVSFAAATLPAAAGEEASVTSTTSTTVPANATTRLAGVSVAAFDPDAMVEVTVSTDVGTLSMTDNLGNLVLNYGNSWSGDPSISFWTLPRDANLALASLSLTTGRAAGPAHVTITGMERAPGYVYSPTNGHFYSYVADTSVTWEEARVAARGLTFMGQSGYLATMNSAALNDLVSNRIAGAANVFFGAMATDTYGQPVQRTWAWADGPLAGEPISYCSNGSHACDHVNDSDFYSSWAPDEPNNFAVWDNGTGEWVGLTNVGGSAGLWNDIPGNTSGYPGYVVEYGDEAQGATGFDGLYSDTSTVQITHVAAAATEVTAAGGNHSATVSFIPGDDNGATVTGYRVTASPGGATADCPTSPCTVTGLTNGTSYTFSVVALAGDDTSPASADSNAVTPATRPEPPTAVTARAGAGSATVTFTAPSDDGGSPVTSYTVTAAPGGATQQCPGSPCVVTGLDNGTPYRLTVHATNELGSSAEAGPSNEVTPAPPTTKPGAPTMLSLKPGDRTLALTFAPPTSDGGSAITSYQYSEDQGRSWTRVSLKRPLRAVDAGVLNGASYTVLVRAVNRHGAGPTSTATIRVPAWFTDPVSRAAHQREIAVPAHPKSYHGPRRYTRAHARSQHGTIAMADTRLKGRQLQRGQAVDLALFDFDNATLDKAGRARVKAVAKSLRYVHAITCEGYADYAGTTSREKALAKKRSSAVCALVHRYATQVSSRKTVSYGPKRPAVVGGHASDRALNRRVVIVIR